MKRAKVFAAVIFGMLMLVQAAIVSTSSAQERRLKREQLPAAVQKTVSEQSKIGRVRGISAEREKGKILYEVELTQNRHEKDILIDDQGNIVEVEDEVPLSSVSPDVKAGLLKAAGTGTISHVESLTKNGKIVAYEAVVKNGSKNQEIQVAPNGSKLADVE
jgi:uncharacterized membrane protein YkoI